MTGNKYLKKAIVILSAASLVFTLSSCKKEPLSQESPEEMPAQKSSEQTAGVAGELLVIELGFGVGPVKFGMSKEEVIKHIGQPDKIEAVMQDVVRLDYISSRGLLFGFNPTGGINYIKCYSEGYPGFSQVTTFAERTKKGVAMGASRNQIITTYGEPDRTASKGSFTILYYDNLRSELITTDNKLVGIKMVGPK